MACFCLTTVMAANQRFRIAEQGKTAQIIVDDQDWKGVIRAARDLSHDVLKVSGVTPEVVCDNQTEAGSIIVGTIGKSRIIDKLVKQKKLDVNGIRGKWESSDARRVLSSGMEP